MATPTTETPQKSSLGKKIKRYFFLFLFLIVLAGVGLWTYTTFTCYSDGERPGSVSKFSRKGILFKTWEGELFRSDYQTAQQWTFSVQDPAIATKIEAAIRDNKKVVLHYCQKYYKFPWQGDSEYFVDKVEIAGQ